MRLRRERRRFREPSIPRSPTLTTKDTKEHEGNRNRAWCNFVSFVVREMRTPSSIQAFSVAMIAPLLVANTRMEPPAVIQMS